MIYYIIIIIIILYLLIKINKKKIIFMNKNDVINFIINDKDNYIKNMSKYDLYARKVNSHHEYINLIVKHCLDFTDEQKNIMYKCTNKTFKIALIDNVYEEGLPHTREDIIFISPQVLNNIYLNKIINHELIHIDQRYNKRNYKNYTISRKRNNEPLIRANPDLDEYIYMNENKLELYYIYASIYPFGINDVIRINNLEEHPYEIEAYNNE